MVRALEPMNATSARMSASARRAASPTTACVMARTWPPSSCSSMYGAPASVRALGSELVTTDQWRSSGKAAMSSASASVVVPASRKTPPPDDGR